MEVLKLTTRDAGDMEAISEKGEAVVVTSPKSPQPDDVRMKILENGQ